MENRIQTDIMAAMKAKDDVALTTLRGIKTAIMQYKTSSNFKGDRDSNLPDAEVIKIMQKLAKERRETAEVYKNAGRTELGDISENSGRSDGRAWRGDRNGNEEPE